MAALSKGLSIDIEEKTFPAVAGRAALPVLGRVKLEIENGTFAVLTGNSGCGKTTLLNIVAGLDNDFAGRISFGGGPRRLSYIFQSPRLLPWRTVEENVALACDEPNMDRVREMLKRVGLKGRETAYPERLSLGMQRRVSLARGFVREPDVLLMDEPFVSLDKDTAAGLRQLLIDLWSRRPTTVLFVTHDRAEAIMLATRLLRLAGEPATIVQDTAVSLSRDERASRDAVAATENEIFGAA